MKEIYEQIKQEGIDISKIVQKKATKLKNKLVADITSHKRHLGRSSDCVCKCNKYGTIKILMKRKRLL